MLEIKEEKNIFDTNKEIINDINYLFIYIDKFPIIKQLLTSQSKFNKENIDFNLKYTNKILSIFLNDIDNNRKIRIFNTKKVSRIINYLTKKSNKELIYKNKKDFEFFKNIISKFLFLFAFNIFKIVLFIKKINNNNAVKKNISILHLNYFLNKVLKIIGIFYVTNNVNDDIFEEIIKINLLFSLSKNFEKAPNIKEEITNMMFFSSSINLIKYAFNKLYINQNKYTQWQEELLNNIIIYIHNSILGKYENEEKQSYINKIFLSRNDYKTSLLIDLSFITSKVKSKDIKDNFINLLTDIYSFSFNYENCMRPTLQLLEPLFININKKFLNQIKNELKIADFSLSFINSLIDKENNILKINSCMLKRGFFFGNNSSGITYELNSLENEFLIMFGFKIESTEMDSMLLFDIVNTKNNNSQIQFYLAKTTNTDSYELVADDSKNLQMQTKINIYEGKTYIFTFFFKMKGLMQPNVVKINYVKDDKNNKDDFSKNVLNGLDLKFKSFKNENLCIYFGCQQNIRKGILENKFRGFLGDIIILNMKNIKDKSDLEFQKYLLNLGGNYYKILSIFSENISEFKFTYDLDFNPKYNELKEQIKQFNDYDNKLFKAINIIISPEYFKLIEYQDDIDYLNIKNNYNYYLEKKGAIFKIKKKYFDLNIKSDNSEEKKNLKIYNSYFDKNFHIFENELCLNGFIKYDGIQYLSLLLEYYYQILKHLYEIKDKYDNKDIKIICKEINEKILNVLNFFNIKIIQKKIILKNCKEINQFFYQMAVTLLQFIQIEILDLKTIKYLVKMLNIFDNFVGEYIENNIYINFFILIRKNLYDFLLNPKLYQKIDEFYYEKLNYIFLNLLLIIKNNSEGKKSNYMKDIFDAETLKKLLAFIWILDNDGYMNKEEKIVNNNDRIFEKVKDYYALLLIEFMKSSFHKNIIKGNSDKNIIQIKENDEKAIKSSKILMLKERKIELIENHICQKNMFNYFFEKIIEQRKNKNLFFNMSFILAKTGLIKELEESEIEKIQYLLIKEINEKEENNYENKKINYLSCIMILIEYYFSGNKNDRLNNIMNKKSETDFHKFIRCLDINMNFFYSLISSIQYVKNISNDKDKEIEIIQNQKSQNNNSIDIENDIKKLKKNYYISSFSGLIFMEISIEDINENQAFIIKAILEDIIYLLYKLERKKLSTSTKKDSNNKVDSFNSSYSPDQNIGKEIYEILKKNIDIIFRFSGTELYDQIFSFENEICAELFYLKWKLDGEGGQNYIEKAIMKYNKDLLKNHYSSFIFKFLFFISNENALPLDVIIYDEDINKYRIKVLKLRINLMIFIIESLCNYQKELKEKNKNITIIYINNLLNFLILLNEELDYKINIIFNNAKFCEALYKYILLIEKSGLIYSNYCIELNENCGKIICESIYDLFFTISDNEFNEDIFTKLFTKVNKKEKEIFTIFYLIDLCKENILEKEKNFKEKLYNFIPELLNKSLFHNSYLKTIHYNKNIKLFLHKKMSPIEDINFSMYFLAKSFIYFDSILMKKKKNEFKDFLINKFLPLLSKNIIRLYAKRINFYGNKRCQKFPLYSCTKKYFESYFIQNPNDFEKIKKFFRTDMKVNLKQEYNIFYCYSSRLLYEMKNINNTTRFTSLKYMNNDNILSSTQSFVINRTTNILDNNNEDNISLNSIQMISTKSTYTSNLKDLNLSNKTLTLKSLEELDNSNSSENFELIRQNADEEAEFISTFEAISKNSIIFNPKNFFFKKIFSEIYKNIIFNDKPFKKLRNTYLINFRKNKNVCTESKQMNYPIKQKNFSNFLEPNIFLRRDYNFYDNIFFPISHQYIKNKDILKSSIENIILYSHKYRFIKEEANKSLFCELVTRQYIYFGKMYFFEKFIIFETQEDPRNDINFENNENISEHEYEIFNKFIISTKSKDNYNSKYKIILIFNEEIKEVIKRRTLLVNNSIEISEENGKSFFFNFFREKEVEKVYKYLNEINQRLAQLNLSKFNFKTNNNDDIKNVLSKFRTGKIPTYEYLLYLNKYSTRTYNDLTQYPVFPWLVLEHDKIEEIFSSKEKDIDKISFIRQLNYPISLQTVKKINDVLRKFKNEKNNSKFPSHLFKHYSTAGYTYYYLIRINPYGQNIIALQNYKIEDANRVFNSFNEIEEIFKFDTENRELIPDIFCYIDYFCNLNCSFLGKRNNGEINDDFNMRYFPPSKYINKIASYVYLLYMEKKLLNNLIITKNIYKWVDIIFGKKQLPEKIEEIENSCNIYNKESYEQKTNFENKLNKYQKLKEQNKIDKKIIIDKIKAKLIITMNFGQTPKQILKDSNIFDEDNKLNSDDSFKPLKVEEKLFFFKKISNNNYLILKNDKKKNKNKISVIYEIKNFKLKENNMYDCKSLNLIIKNKSYTINLDGKNIKIPLYNPDYAISYLFYQNEKINKAKIPIILSCRYLGNYFNLQTYDKQLNIFCEDFVTCIKGRQLKNIGDHNFFTGLLNGKLIHWKIHSYLSIKEVKHVCCHKSSITVIEIFKKQRIVITTGEDKFIHIRKIFDFELLTVIDLSYSFGNPIVSQTQNVFPSLIRISNLNLLYILLYDFDSKVFIIRGYNLNGLFFAQTNDKNFKDKNNNTMLINNISFTKNSNLVIGFYNSNKYCILCASRLIPLYPPNNIQGKEIIEKYGTKLIEYDYSSEIFYVLYDNEFKIMIPKEMKELKNLDNF